MCGARRARSVAEVRRARWPRSARLADSGLRHSRPPGAGEIAVELHAQLVRVGRVAADARRLADRAGQPVGEPRAVEEQGLVQPLDQGGQRLERQQFAAAVAHGDADCTSRSVLVPSSHCSQVNSRAVSRTVAG